MANKTNPTEVSTTKGMLMDTPDWLKTDSNRGSENISAGDVIVPRLDLVQDLSPCRKKTDPSYIEGIEEGMLYNSVTRQNYGVSVLIVPVYFKKEFVIWGDRASGGGFGGTYPSMKTAFDAMSKMPDADKSEITETNQHFCLLINTENGTCEEIVLSMAKSKMKTSKKLNSLIRMNGSDSFSRVYKLSAVAEKNSKNQGFYGLDIASVGFPTKDIYVAAEEMYTAILNGSLKADQQAPAESMQTDY